MDMKGSESSFEAKQKVCTVSGLEFMVLLKCYVLASMLVILQKINRVQVYTHPFSIYIH